MATNKLGTESLETQPVNLSNKIKARKAGLLYLVVVLTGIFSLAYVPSKLIEWNDAAATLQNIKDHEFMFRLSIVSGVVCYVFFLFLPLALYKLLSQVDESYARIMVLLAVVSVPISILNWQNKLAVLTLIGDSNYLMTHDVNQLSAQVMFFLNQYNNGILVIQIFWGLWLFPFGYLLYKSGFLPKVLGVLLMAGCFGYLINFTGDILVSDYAKMGLSSWVDMPAALGEIGTCLWLIIMGAKEKATTY